MRKTRMTGGVIRVFVYREKTAADVWNTAAKGRLFGAASRRFLRK